VREVFLGSSRRRQQTAPSRRERGRGGSAGRVVGAWTYGALLVGAGLGASYGGLSGLVLAVYVAGRFLAAPLGLVYGSFAGGVIGMVAGIPVGLFAGLLAAFVGPASGSARVTAAAATELVLLPAQIWLYAESRSDASFYFFYYQVFVIVPSALGICAAALFGGRLSPGVPRP